METPKPKLFIGSSTESLPVAEVLQSQLSPSAAVQLWNQGIFGISNYTLDSLLAASKEFAVTERWKFQLRGEAFNLANRPIYRPAPTSITDINFGKLSIEQQNFPRNIQVSAKLLF